MAEPAKPERQPSEALYCPQCAREVDEPAEPRSAGGRHDFFSEGDYWWPDPANPGWPERDRF